MAYPKGKLTTLNSAANILTDFNPSSFYTNNGNYLKFVVYVDWTNTPMSNTYLFSGEREWFTVENFGIGGIYFNMGTGGTGLGQNLATNTQEFEKPMTVILNNGVASFEQDGNTASVSFSALTPTTFTLWRTNNGYNFRGSFYGFEVYDRDGNMAHNYIPWQDANNTPCVVDAVTDNVFYPTGTNYQLVYESLVSFYPSQDTFTFNANGGTQTFTVEADNAWTCTAPTDFTISPMSGNSGTTTVTITAPRRISTISETITFTDAQSNTFDISVSQSVGTESPNLTLYQGSTTIKKMYQGTDLIYRKLAVSPTLTISGDTFNFPPTSYTAATVVVTSDTTWTYSVSENWLTVTRTSNNLEIVPTSDWDQGSAPRTATITVTADNGFITKSAEISVKQSNTNVTNVDWVWVENYGTDTGLYFDTGIYPTVNTSFRVKYIPIRPIGSTIVGFGPAGSGSTPTGSTSDNNDYRFFSAQNIGYAYWDFNSSRQNWSMLTTDADGYITAECGNNYVTDVNSGVTHTASAQTSIATTGVPIYLNLSNDLKVQSLEIFENGVKVYDGHSAYDGENYGWNDSISGTFTTQTYGGYTMAGAPVPDLTDYLCFTAEQAGSTVGMMNYRTDASIDTPVLYYSRDKVMWVQWDYSPITLSNVGDKVYFYGNDGRISRNSSNYSSFQMSGRIAASGDVTTLITRNGTTQLTHNYCFIHLFDGCTSLTTAPELPATTFGQFASNCYDSMFQGCTSLTTAPALPATTLPHQCYIAMFQGCTSLTTAPELPATTLIGKCYQSMFAGCTSLVTAPELPATTIANGCYQSMFEGCTALTTAPELPATTLDVASYMYMFRGCTSLNTVKCLAEDISAQICTYQWLDGVSATGTFTKSANMNDWTSGINGIPSGWTVVDA